jgi:hypothetical protein
MPGNMFIPPPQRPNNPMMGLLTQLALMKVQHDWSMEEKQLALEAKKIETDAAKAEVRTKSKSDAMMQGAEFSNPTGPVVGTEAYSQPEGTQYDPYYGQNVKPPSDAKTVLENGKVIGHVDRKGTLHYLPKDSEAGGSVPTDLKSYELANYGKLTPELRGTQAYRSGMLKWIGDKQEQNPSLVFSQQNLDLSKRSEAGRLRTEFYALPEVKTYNEMSRQFGNIKEAMEISKDSDNKVATDQALINTFNKMMDPQSVVRESEYARTKNDLSLMNRIKGAVGSWVEGGPGLTDDDRNAILKMAEKFNKVAEEKFKAKHNEYRWYYSNLGIPPENYLKTQGPQQPVKNEALYKKYNLQPE